MGRLGASNTGFPWMRVTDDERLLFCTDKLTEFYGVDPKTITNWVKKGCPREKSGWYDIKAVNNWLQDTDGQGDDAFNEARKLKAEIRQKEERTAILEIDRAAKEGLYYAKADVEREFSTRVLEVKAVLMGLGKTIANEFTDPDIRAEVKRVVADEVRKALDQYSRDGVYCPKVRWDS